jgi:hypothetical protein
MTESHKIKSVFISNGKHYIFESDSFEPREHLNKRVWFIIKYLEDNKIDSNKIDMEELIVKSRMWLNEQIFDAKYS